jgi:phosphatidylglycerophosphatase A
MTTPASVWRNPIHFLAFGLGSGASPKAPGTLGTLAALVPYYFMQDLSQPIYVVVLVVSAILGIYLCGKTARDIGVHDHGGIVWDEFVGMWLTLFAAPQGWQWIAIGFVLFRVFDILKPMPIAWLDRRVHGGIGIMLDDIVAGTFAWLCLQGIAMSGVISV